MFAVNIFALNSKHTPVFIFPGSTSAILQEKKY